MGTEGTGERDKEKKEKSLTTFISSYFPSKLMKKNTNVTLATNDDVNPTRASCTIAILGIILSVAGIVMVVAVGMVEMVFG